MSLQDAVGSFSFPFAGCLWLLHFPFAGCLELLLQDAFGSFFSGRLGLLSWREILRFVLTETYCSSGSQLASYLDLR